MPDILVELEQEHCLYFIAGAREDDLHDLSVRIQKNTGC